LLVLTRRDITLFSWFLKNFPNIGVDKYVIFGVLKMREETGDRRQETEDRETEETLQTGRQETDRRQETEV